MENTKEVGPAAESVKKQQHEPQASGKPETISVYHVDEKTAELAVELLNIVLIAHQQPDPQVELRRQRDLLRAMIDDPTAVHWATGLLSAFADVIQRYGLVPGAEKIMEAIRKHQQ